MDVCGSPEGRFLSGAQHTTDVSLAPQRAGKYTGGSGTGGTGGTGGAGGGTGGTGGTGGGTGGTGGGTVGTGAAGPLLNKTIPCGSN